MGWRGALLMRRMWHTSNRERLVLILRLSRGTAATGAVVHPWSDTNECSQSTRDLASELAGKNPRPQAQPDTQADTLRILRNLCTTNDSQSPGAIGRNDYAGQGSPPTLEADHWGSAIVRNHARGLREIHEHLSGGWNGGIHTSKNSNSHSIHSGSCWSKRSPAKKCSPTFGRSAISRATEHRSRGTRTCIYIGRNRVLVGSDTRLRSDSGHSNGSTTVVGLADTVRLALGAASHESIEHKVVLVVARWLACHSAEAIQATENGAEILHLEGRSRCRGTNTHRRRRQNFSLEQHHGLLSRAVEKADKGSPFRTPIWHKGHSAGHIDLAGGTEPACFPPGCGAQKTGRARGFLRPAGSCDSASRIHACAQGMGSLDGKLPMLPPAASAWAVQAAGYHGTLAAVNSLRLPRPGHFR